MNFEGKWRLRNGWEAEVKTLVDGRWYGVISIKATTVPHNWDANGDSENKDLDLMERLGWRARV